VITSYKLGEGAQSDGSGNFRVDNRLVRMSFQTDRPFYPYREPVDAAAQSGLTSGRGQRDWPAVKRTMILALALMRAAGFRQIQIGRHEEIRLAFKDDLFNSIPVPIERAHYAWVDGRPLRKAAQRLDHALAHVRRRALAVEEFARRLAQKHLFVREADIHSVLPARFQVLRTGPCL
jgi:hypothetical protein